MVARSLADLRLAGATYLTALHYYAKQAPLLALPLLAPAGSQLLSSRHEALTSRSHLASHARPVGLSALALGGENTKKHKKVDEVPHS